MTSNIGSHIIQENFEKVNPKNVDELTEKTKDEVFDLLKKTIRPEFLNRIDEIIMFKPLNEQEVRDIVWLQLKQLASKLIANDIKLHITKEAVNLISSEGFDPQFGARPIKRIIQKQVLNELSKQLLSGKIDRQNVIVMDAIDKKIVFRKPIKQEEEVEVAFND